MEPIRIGQHTRTHNNFLAVTNTRHRLTNSCNYHNNLHNPRKANTVRNQSEVLWELALENAPEVFSLEVPSISVDSRLRSLPKEVLVQEMSVRANHRFPVPAQLARDADRGGRSPPVRHPDLLDHGYHGLFAQPRQLPRAYARHGYSRG